MPDSVVGEGSGRQKSGMDPRLDGMVRCPLMGGGRIEEETVLGEKDAFHF